MIKPKQVSLFHRLRYLRSYGNTYGDLESGGKNDNTGMLMRYKAISAKKRYIRASTGVWQYKPDVWLPAQYITEHYCKTQNVKRL